MFACTRVHVRIHKCNVTHCMYIHIYKEDHAKHTELRRPIGCLVFTGHFPQKSPIICGSFARKDLQL